MKLPDLYEYQAMVQVPWLAFTDQVLQSGHAELNPQGLPMAISGGFALTFKVRAAGQVYAVRCFHKEGNLLGDRYQEICAFVWDHPDLSFLLDVDYDPGGIRVAGTCYPIMKLPWVEGDTLSDWLEDNVHDTSALREVRSNIRAAARALHGAGAAHGDLQHGNILVCADRSIRLIDYDGMFLPSLADFGPAERGHRNYQHPDRGNAFDATIDAFSAAVVGLSLAALEHEPELWEQCNNSDNLLLTSDDYANPDGSETFARLCAVEPVAEYARRLRAACKAEFAAVPAVLAGERVGAAAVRRIRKPTGPEVLRAVEADVLRLRQGEIVTVFGKVTSTRVHKQANGTININFGDYRRADFTIVVFAKLVREALREKYGEDLDELEGEWVSLAGMVELYQGKQASERTPQIVLRQARALRMLSLGDVEKLAAAAERVPAEPDDDVEDRPGVDEIAATPSEPDPEDGALNAEAQPSPARERRGADDLELRLSQLYSKLSTSPGEPGPPRSAPPVGGPAPQSAPPRSTPVPPPPVPPNYRVEQLPFNAPPTTAWSPQSPQPPPPPSPTTDPWSYHTRGTWYQPPPGPPAAADFQPHWFDPPPQDSRPPGLFQRIVDSVHDKLFGR